MTEIRCPMCGKPNPEHLETCEFCQARLKSLIADSDSVFSDLSKSDSEELPDWFDIESPDLSDNADDSPLFEEDDWLARLEGDSEPQKPSQPPFEPEQIDDSSSSMPDWLADFDENLPNQTADSTAEDEPFPFDDSGDLSDRLFYEDETAASDDIANGTDQPEDWIAQFGKQETVPLSQADYEESALPDWLLAAEPESVEPAAAAEEALPAWLSEMEASAAVEESEPEPTAEESALPDWLLAAEPESVESAAASEEALPAWLSEMEASAAVEESEPEPAAEESALPDWLLAAEPESVESAAAAEEALPAWLSEMEASAAVEESEPEPAAEESALPDWLLATEPESVEPAAASEEALPDWLSEMEASAAVEESEPEPAAEEGAGVAPFGEEDLLGWLSDLDESASTADAFPEQEQSLDEGLPEWLKGMSAGAMIASVGQVDEELPAWLSGTESEADAFESGAVEGDLPEWLADVPGFSVPPEEEPATSSPDAVVSESRAVPPWLQGDDFAAQLEVEIPAETEAAAVPESVSPFMSDDEFADDLMALGSMSAWGADESASAGDQAASAEIDLAPAELPGWLAAMRPVEPSVEGEPVLGPVETSGPLAGLQSILSAEPEIFRLKQAPVYYSKLQVTEAQQAHAVLLQNLLETESKPKALPAAPLVSSHAVFKAVLGTILVIVALLAVLGGTQMTAMPQTIPAGVQQTSQLVSQLTPQDAVLLAFDYEPGLAGEMDAAAAAVVDHIMLQGARLALISTSPTGPVLAEHFIEVVQGEHQYASGKQYVNLGYIPGGVSGLAAFARSPQWVASNTLDGERAWETAPLQNVNRLSDFAMVLVITDHPNTAQAWIEQVEPQLGSVPLVAVVSAQVEPLIRPYYESQQAQLNGLISGLAGGAAYEVMSRANLARSYWDAFNLVLIVAVSTILIGSGIMVISDLLARRKETGGRSA